MSPFTQFAKTYGTPTDRRPATPVQLSEVGGVVPALLLEHWASDGFGAYAKGLIWTHPPNEFAAILEEWTAVGPPYATLVARFSFGDFCYWSKERLFFVDVQGGIRFDLGTDISLLFDHFLCNADFLDQALRRKVHETATANVGTLSSGDVFAFVPALAIGGKAAAESVVLAPLAEHLAFLAQVVGPLADIDSDVFGTGLE